MKKDIKTLIVFLSICAVMTVLLATTNYVTAPIIEKNQNASQNQALVEVLPEGQTFETVNLSDFTLPDTVKEVYKETTGKGYVIKLVTSGYGNDMVIMCGVGSDQIVKGALCLSSNETLGKEKSYGQNFISKDASGVETVDTITGATKTTSAYKNAIKDALNTSVILGGGSVDIRTEEEILSDNLNEALPLGEKNFEKLFLIVDLEGVDAVYAAKNEAGYVFVKGEQFIGVNSDGTVMTEDVENTELYTDAVNKIKTITVEDIDLSQYPDLQKTVVSLKKTTEGIYIVETKGAGYGIKGGNEYHPASGEYIIVQVSITPDYRIIDCFTVSEGETDNLGDACNDESFYGQFKGKTQENYTEIDAISGATLTTNGYKQAVERAFNAVKTVKGEF